MEIGTHILLDELLAHKHVDPLPITDGGGAAELAPQALECACNDHGLRVKACVVERRRLVCVGGACSTAASGRTRFTITSGPTDGFTGTGNWQMWPNGPLR